MKKVFITLLLLVSFPFTVSATLLDNLTAYWTLDETSGVRVDSHGSNDLSDNNTVLYATGLIGNASDYEVSNSEYLSITDGSASGFEPTTGGISFGGWYKAESNLGGSQGATLLGKFGAGGNRSWALTLDTYNYLGHTKHLNFEMFDATCTQTSLLSASNWEPPVGTWVHLVAVADDVNNTLTIYKDGSSYLTTAWTGSGVCDSTAIIQQSGSDNQTGLDGLADEWFFYDRPLTSSEVSELYASGSGLTYPFGLTEGCTDPEAENYDADADIDDGSCTYSSPLPTGNNGNMHSETLASVIFVLTMSMSLYFIGIVFGMAFRPKRR